MQCRPRARGRRAAVRLHGQVRNAARGGASAGGRVAVAPATSRRGGHVLRRGPGPRTMWRLGGDTGDGRVRGVPPAPCVARACIPAWPRLPRTHAGASPAALADSFPALPWPRWVRCIACQLPRQKSSLSLSLDESARVTCSCGSVLFKSGQGRCLSSASYSPSPSTLQPQRSLYS